MDLKLQKGSRGQAAKRPPPRADPAGAGAAEGGLRAQPGPTAEADKGWGGPRRPRDKAAAVRGAGAPGRFLPPRGATAGGHWGAGVGGPGGDVGHEARGMARAGSRAIPLAACPGRGCRPSSVLAAPSRAQWGCPTAPRGQAAPHRWVMHPSMASSRRSGWVSPRGRDGRGHLLLPTGLTPRAGCSARALGQRCDPWHRALMWGTAPAPPTRLAQAQTPQEQPLRASTSHGPDSRVREGAGRPEQQRSSD